MSGIYFAYTFFPNLHEWGTEHNPLSPSYFMQKTWFQNIRYQIHKQLIVNSNLEKQSINPRLE